jgi:hypothetical protein
MNVVEYENYNKNGIKIIEKVCIDGKIKMSMGTLIKIEKSKKYRE